MSLGCSQGLAATVLPLDAIVPLNAVLQPAWVCAATNVALVMIASERRPPAVAAALLTRQVCPLPVPLKLRLAGSYTETLTVPAEPVNVAAPPSVLLFAELTPAVTVTTPLDPLLTYFWFPALDPLVWIASDPLVVPPVTEPGPPVTVDPNPV